MKKSKTTIFAAFSFVALSMSLFAAGLTHATPTETAAAGTTERYFFDSRWDSAFDDGYVIAMHTWSSETGDLYHECTQLDDNCWYIDIDLTPYAGCRFVRVNGDDTYFQCEWDAKTGNNYCFKNNKTSWWTKISTWKVEGRTTLDGEWGSIDVPMNKMRFDQEKGLEYYADIHLDAYSEFQCHSADNVYVRPDTYGYYETAHDLGAYFTNNDAQYPLPHNTTSKVMTVRDNNVVNCAAGDFRITMWPVYDNEAYVNALSLEFPHRDSQLYIRGTVHSLGMINDWGEGIALGTWHFDHGNRWWLQELRLSNEDCFKFYVDGYGWIGFENWDLLVYNMVPFGTDDGGTNIVPQYNLTYYLSVYEEYGQPWWGQGTNRGSTWINGTVASLGLDGSAELRSAPLDDLIGIYLKPTDHFTFSSSMFYHAMDFTRVWDAESLDLLVNKTEQEDYDLYVKTEGYYDFSIVNNSSLVIRRSSMEDVTDGFYLRGVNGNWDKEHQLKMKRLSGDRYIVGPLHLAAGDEIKAVNFRGHVAHYCEIAHVTSENPDYLAYKPEGNVKVTVAGDYYLQLNRAGMGLWSYHFYEQAKGFAIHFLNSMTCDPTGQTTPDYDEGMNWNQLKADFLTLDDDAKDKIFAAKADPNGNEIEEMLARYEILVAGHGYEAFIKNSSGVYRNFAPASTASPNGNTAILLGAFLASTGAASLGLFFIANRKRKNRLSK